MNSEGGKNIRLLKILCLHGYRQSGEVFKKKIGSLRKALKKYAEFVFITAPNKIPFAEDSSVLEEDQNEQYAWWFSTEEKTFNSKAPSDVALGFENSLNLIEKTFKEQGPFDGLLGFSQGAAFVGILCGMQETNWLAYNFNFAIMVAGFKSLCHPHLNYYFKEASLPSLHVYGNTDECINKEMSELLTKQFENPQMVIHSGGHFVPASEPYRQGYIHFLEEVLKEKEEEDKRKQKQIQIGSFILEEIEDNNEEKDDSENNIIKETKTQNNSDGKSKQTKNKGGITKQERRQKLKDQTAKAEIEST